MPADRRVSTSNGEPRRPLADQIERGLRLIDLAGGIEDQEGFHLWRGDRNLWLWEAAEALGELRGERAAEVFRKVTSVAVELVPTWQAVLPREVERVRVALRLLRRFQDQGCLEL